MLSLIKHIFVAVILNLHLSAAYRPSEPLNFILTETKDTLSRVVRHRRNVDDAVAKVTSLKIKGRVCERFSETSVLSTLENLTPKNSEAAFSVQLPETAFISHFSMIIDGVETIGVVKSKEQVEKEYEEAKKNNKTAGKVGQERNYVMKDFGMEMFSVKANIKAQSSASFTLKYQELLTRRAGYFHALYSFRPPTVVDGYELDFELFDTDDIDEITFKPPGKETFVTRSNEVTLSDRGTVKVLKYKPTTSTQQALLKDDLMYSVAAVKFDVKHKVKVIRPAIVGANNDDNRYAIVLFSPDLPHDPLAKNIIFVIDISGSMSGLKMEQTRLAMDAILPKLRPIDQFQLILFNSNLKFWQEFLVQATPAAIASARGFCKENLKANGGTNIDSAMQVAAQMMQKLESKSLPGQNMIFFLTDGEPSYGETNPVKIVENIMGNLYTSGYDASSTECPKNPPVANIFSLAFGIRLNFDLLYKLSRRSLGSLRKIDDMRMVKEQVVDFLDEIANPLMFDMSMVFDKTLFDESEMARPCNVQYLYGSEIPMAVRLKPGVLTPKPMRYEGKTSSSDVITMECVVDPTQNYSVPPVAEGVCQNPSRFAGRVTANLIIKDLLRKEDMVTKESVKAGLKRRAVELAIKHQLVTPYTSMIVVEKDLPAMQNEMDNAVLRSGKSYNAVLAKGGTATICIPFPGFVSVVLFAVIIILSV